jgi:hypothetical protein
MEEDMFGNILSALIAGFVAVQIERSRVDKQNKEGWHQLWLEMQIEELQAENEKLKNQIL